MGRRRAKTETEEEKKCRNVDRAGTKGKSVETLGAGTGQGKGITQDSSNWTQGRERDTGQRQQDMCSQAEATRERITDCPEGTYIDPGEYNSPDLTVGEEVTTRWGQ